jgi:hypothetical protein
MTIIYDDDNDDDDQCVRAVGTPPRPVQTPTSLARVAVENKKKKRRLLAYTRKGKNKCNTEQLALF